MEGGKQIKGFEDYYIFEDGRIYSSKTKKFLIPFPNSTKQEKAYLQIGLRKNGKRKMYLIHRLIAEHFIPNPENKKCVDHINRNRLDNTIENLRWVSSNENMKNKHLELRNTIGFRGVHFRKTQGDFGIIWNDKEGLPHKKSFSINKYGFMPALKMAVEKRYEKEKENEYTSLLTPQEYYKTNQFLQMMYEWN